MRILYIADRARQLQIPRISYNQMNCLPKINLFLPTISVIKVIPAPSMCLFSWVCESYVVHHQQYKTTLCTTDLHCALVTDLHCASWCTRETYVAMGVCTDVHFGGAQCSFVLTRWCTQRFCSFVISSDREGAQYNVDSQAELPGGACGPSRWSSDMFVSNACNIGKILANLPRVIGPAWSNIYCILEFKR